MKLFEDPSRRPRVVHNVDAFLEELKFGCHMDDIVVLRNGIEKLGLFLFFLLCPSVHLNGSLSTV